MEGSVIRSPAQVERDIEARRQRLAGSIDALVERVNPRNVAQRKADEVRARVDDVRSRVTDADGKPRPELLGAAAGAVVVVVVLVVLARRRR